VSFTLDYTTDIGKVRAIIMDVESESAAMQDEQIQAFLTIEGNVKLAAAQALDAIASNEALVQKRIQILDLKTDGPATAKSLREHADKLREQVDDDGSFEFVEQVNNVFGEREVLLNELYKEL
jgi:hypothetical protein